MTEVRDAHPCAIDGWVKIPGGAYARVYEPCRPYQFRVVKDLPTEPDSQPVQPDLDSQQRPEADLGWRGIPRRNPDSEQLVLF